MEGRQLLQYIIDTSDIVLAKKQEATEYLAKLESRPTPRAVDVCLTSPTKKHVWGVGSRDGVICIHCAAKRR